VWTSKTFFSRGSEPFVTLPGREDLLRPVHGSWALFWNMDQYLVVDPGDPPKGWGLFARAALADGRPNPLRSFYSLGLGGNSPVRGRQDDRFGIGWYYAQASNQFDVIGGDLVRPHDGQGLELFYNVAVTPWFHLTADAQVLRGGLPGTDTAAVLGLRAKIDF
jgi:porin